jgi:hypothetical protein
MFMGDLVVMEVFYTIMGSVVIRLFLLLQMKMQSKKKTKKTMMLTTE